MSDHLSAERFAEIRQAYASTGSADGYSNNECQCGECLHLNSLHDLAGDVPDLFAHIDAQAATIQRVADLHGPAPDMQWIIPNTCAYGECDHDDDCPDVKIEVCAECSRLASAIDGGECFIEHPCVTALALAGVPNE